ncbi:MAG: ribosomal protein L7/L12 [Clostridia bacterium]|nr:ribosomal protein L7/L12 [Clostridia bacterium]
MAPDDYSDLTREELLERLKALEGKPDAYSVELVSCGENRVAVIKVVNQLFGHALKEAMDLVDSAPCIVAKDLAEADADWICSMFNDAGAITRKIGSAAPAAPAEPAPAPAEPAPAAPAEPAPAAPETEPVIIALSKLTGIEGGASVNMVLTVAGDYKANGLNAAIKYDPNVLTLKGVSVGKVLESFDDATVSLSYKSTPGTIRLIVMAGTEPITGRGALAKLEFEVAKNFYEASFVTPEIREFRAPNGTNIEHSVSEGVLIPVEGAAPAPESEKPAEPAPVTPAEPAPVTPAEPAPVTPAEPDPVKPEERPVHPVDGGGRPGRPSRPSRPVVPSRPPIEPEEKPAQNSRPSGNSVNSRPSAPAETARPSSESEKPQTVTAFELSSQSKVKKAAIVTSVLSCTGGEFAQELNATVKFDPKRLSFKQFIKGAALTRYTDLTVSAAVESKEDTIVVKVAAPAGKSFKAEGDLIKLMFDVQKVTKDPAVLTLDVQRFGSMAAGAFKQLPFRTDNGVFEFEYIEIDETKPHPAAENHNCGPDNYKPRRLVRKDLTIMIDSAVGHGINLLDDTIGDWYSYDQVMDKRLVNFTGIAEPTNVSPVGKWNVDHTTEKSLEKVAEKLSVSASVTVGVGLFKSTVSSTYEKSTNSSAERAYSKLWAHYNAIADSIWDYRKWKSRLRDDFWKDLNDPSVKPDTLFKTYGTHVILKAYYGGVCDINAVSEKKTQDTTTSISASLSMSIGWNKAEDNAAQANANVTAPQGGGSHGGSTDPTAIGIDNIIVAPIIQMPGAGGGEKPKDKDKPPENSVGVEVKTDYTKNTYNESNGLYFKANFIGAAAAQVTNLEGTATAAGKWCAEMAASKNWVFIGPSKESNALYPVWDLLDAGSRRDELKAYYDSHSRYLNFDCERYVTDIVFGWAKDENGARSNLQARCLAADRKGVWISDYHDLNKGCGGSGYLYMAYRVETFSQIKASGHKPITGLFFYCDDKDHKSWQYDRYENWKDSYNRGYHSIKLRGVDIGASFDYIGDRWFSEDSYNRQDIRISNINHGKVTTGRFLLLCATTDPNLEPLTGMCAYYNDDKGTVIFNGTEWLNITQEARTYSATCSTNAGHHDCNDIYIAYKTSEQTWNEILMENRKAEAVAQGSGRTDTTGRETTGRETTGRETTGRETSGRETTGRVTTSRETTGRVTTGRETSGRETTGRETTGRETSGRETSGRETSGRVASGRETARRTDTTGRNTGRRS